MLKLELVCDSAEQARVYLNAQQYFNLLLDLEESFSQVTEETSHQELLYIIDTFLPNIKAAVCNHEGAY
jgi:hypothetical protein